MLTSFWHAFRCAGRGVGLAFGGRNFRLMVVAAMAAVTVGLLGRLTSGEWGFLVLVVAVVLAVEAVNSAIEELADAVHPAPDPGIGRAKDLAAGASLIVSAAAAVIGLIILWPH